jgi:hypothetical protein
VSACWNTLNKKLEGGLGTWNPAKSVERDCLTAKRERIADADLPDWYARVQTMRNPIQRDGLVLAAARGAEHHARLDSVRVLLGLELPDPGGVAGRYVR